MRCTAGLPFVIYEGMELRIVPPVLDAPREVVVESVEETSVDGGIVWFDGIDDPDKAKMLVGCHLLARRDIVNTLSKRAVLEEQDVDLSGWEAFEEDSGYLGLVVEIREMPGQMMLVIDRSSCDALLVPLVDEFIVGLSEEEKRLDLRLPPGFLTL